MNIVGKRINTLRKEHHMTQEQLANAIGISTPAVSKWENGGSLPDISLLAPLARLLKTDVNDILGYSEHISDKEVDQKVETLRALFEETEFTEAVETAFSSIKEYPNSNYLKLSIASLIDSYKCQQDCESDSIKAITAKCIAYVLEAHNNPSDNDSPIIEPATLSYLIKAYSNDKAYDQAELLLEALPDKNPSKSTLLATVYLEQDKLDDAKVISQKRFLLDFQNILHMIEVMYKVAKKTEDFSLATSYAKDYYNICTLLNNTYLLPSKLLFDLSVVTNVYDEGHKNLKQLIKECHDGKRFIDKTRYTDSIIDSIHTWSSSMKSNMFGILYETIHEEKTYKTFLQLPEIVTEMNHLKELSTQAHQES